MESLGKKLKNAREERGYSIEQVARDTNIARRFIVALEEETFDEFPGDTYLLGFLRNYSEYLGLDPGQMSSLYKNMQIQERPVPMEELIENKKGPSKQLLIAVLLAAVLILGGGGAWYFLVGPGAGDEAVADGQEDRSGAEETDRSEITYEMREEILERRFDEGDVIGVRFGERVLEVKLAEVAETVSLNFSADTASFPLGSERPVDLDGDGTDDIRVGVYDIDASSGTAVLRFDRSLISRGEQQEETGERSEYEGSEAVGSTTEESREEEVETVLTAEETEPYTISANVNDYCMVRYEKDGNVREQHFLGAGESFRLDVSREAMFWVSNAGAVEVNIRGEEVQLGEAGEVAVKLFRWQQDEDTGSYRLLMVPVY